MQDGMKFYLLSMSKIPSDDMLESLYKLRIRASAQLKTVLELYDMEIHQKISMPNYQKLNTMVKKSKIRNYDYETLTPGTGKLKQEQWSRVEKDGSALKEEKVSVTSGKKKASVRKETDAVSGMRVTIVHKNQNTQVCREKEVSRAKVVLVSLFDNRAHAI